MRCKASESPTTRPSSCTDATPKGTPTRSGLAAAPGRSRPAAPRSSCATAASRTSVFSTAATTRGSRPGTRSRVTPRHPLPVESFGAPIPRPSGGHRRHRRGEADPLRSGRRRPRQRPDLERAHRRGQRLQLHPADGTHRGRRLGQLRHRRVPHAALPERGQHDARVPGDRGQLGGSRHHSRQVGRLLLRDRLARERDVVLRVLDGLGADRRVRRRLARVEQGPAFEPDRGRRAAGRRGVKPLLHTGSRAGSSGTCAGLVARDGRVAKTEPTSTSTNPMPMPTVNCSPRIATPRIAATAGFT